VLVEIFHMLALLAELLLDREEPVYASKSCPIISSPASPDV
jgi:hypothetical protein